MFLIRFLKKKKLENEPRRRSGLKVTLVNRLITRLKFVSREFVYLRLMTNQILPSPKSYSIDVKIEIDRKISFTSFRFPFNFIIGSLTRSRIKIFIPTDFMKIIL